MRKLLLAAVAVLGLSGSGNAAVISSFGTDPTSSAGAFSHSLGALVGNFQDQWLFNLSLDATLTIASTTNVFATGSDFITGLTGSVWNAGADGLPGGVGANADAIVIGPILAALGCGPIPNCQGFAGSAFLNAGAYFLQIEGFANGSSGYGGNLAVVAPEVVPLPGAVWLFLSGLGALFGVQRWRKKKEADAALAPA